MNLLNHEVYKQIQAWIESGDWKTDPNFSCTYDEASGSYSGLYTAPWFMDLTEEQYDALNWNEGEQDFYTFHLVIHIYEDESFRLEFDPGLFDLMYKGYDSGDDRKAWEEFRQLTREKGLLFEK
jgi:hypothetical protein